MASINASAWRAIGAMRSFMRLNGRKIFPALLIGLVAFMGISSAAGYIVSAHEQAQLIEFRAVTRNIRTLQEALVNAETGVRGFVLTSKIDYLEPYFQGLASLRDLSPRVLPAIDRYAAQLPAADKDPNPVSSRIAELRKVWQTATGLTSNGKAAEADAALQSMQGKSLMDELRGFVGGFVTQRRADAESADRRIATEQFLMLLINAFGALVAIAGMGYAFWHSARNSAEKETAVVAGGHAKYQIEELFGMTNMLQSASDRDDANEVLCATALRLLPGIGGQLYVFNNSRDRLDLSTAWGQRGDRTRPDYITPNSCWALKRGEPHLNRNGADRLRCSHAGKSPATLEIPMAARGEIYGLLELTAEGDEAEAKLARIQPIASALADAMSLSLSSNTLRERLRNQALRDGLTGLYNRRFLEEMLERLAQEAARHKTSIAAIMIDLDHFKRLNDQFGHAAGDVILREVASLIMSQMRASDVACRYGGEELAVLLADCTLDQAIRKADQIRRCVAELAGPQGVTVTASFGVAAIPETAARVTDLLTMADAALYQAKQQGRNCVVASPTRPVAKTIHLAGD